MNEQIEPTSDHAAEQVALDLARAVEALTGRVEKLERWKEFRTHECGEWDGT